MTELGNLGVFRSNVCAIKIISMNCCITQIGKLGAVEHMEFICVLQKPSYITDNKPVFNPTTSLRWEYTFTFVTTTVEI